MGAPCTCLQCRMLREMYPSRPVTPADRAKVLGDVAAVLGGELAHFDNATTAVVLQQVADLRAQRFYELNDAAGRSTPLASAEVAGHG